MYLFYFDMNTFWKGTAIQAMIADLELQVLYLRSASVIASVVIYNLQHFVEFNGYRLGLQEFFESILASESSESRLLPPYNQYQTPNNSSIKSYQNNINQH